MLDFAQDAQQRNGLKKMNKPLCPLMDELGKPCNHPMFANIPEIYPSDGVEITSWQCFSMNSKHQLFISEPIPGWKSKERKVEIHPNGRRMTPYKRKKILNMLAQIPRITYPEIAKVTGFSTPIICRLKQVTMLAAISTVLKRLQ